MRKNNDDYEAELTWLNLKYTINDNFSIRAGRIQTKVLLHSESFDIDYLQLWAKAPSEVYRLMPIRAYEGVELNYDKTFDDYSMNLSIVTLGRYDDTLNSNKESEFDISIKDSYSATLRVENDTFTYKASYSRSKVYIQDDSTTDAIVNGLRAYGNNMDRFTYENTDVEVFSLCFGYRNNNFILDTEIVRSENKSLLPSSTGAYMLLGYEIDKFIPFIMYAQNKNDKSFYDTSSIRTPDATSTALKRGLDDILYLNNYSQATATMGMRYNIQTGMALKFQLDRITSTNYGSISNSTVQSTGYEKVGILSRDAGTQDKAIYACTVSLSFAY